MTVLANHKHINQDPGENWVKENIISIKSDTPLDCVSVICPAVIKLPNDRYRMYYTARRNIAELAQYGGYILSAVSDDGLHWQKELHICIKPEGDETAIYSPDVIPLQSGGWLMLFEVRIKNRPSLIKAAISEDGLHWSRSKDIKFASHDKSLGSPKLIPIKNSSHYEENYHLYMHSYSFPFHSGITAENHIICVELDANLSVKQVFPPAIKQEQVKRESYAVYAPEVIRIANSGYRMYYSAWSENIRGGIFTATSVDGINWNKSPSPIIDLGDSLDSVMVSEPCIVQISDNQLRIYYEAEDAKGQRYILSAINKI